MPAPRPAVPVIVDQHLEDLCVLHGVRKRLARAAHPTPGQLARVDERLAAHLDGLAGAGDAGALALRHALGRLGEGEAFAAMAVAGTTGDLTAARRLAELAAVSSVVRRGVVAALGFLPTAEAMRVVHPLQAAAPPALRAMALAGWRVQRADPGVALRSALEDDAAIVRVEAARLAAVLGRRDLLGAWPGTWAASRTASDDERVDAAVSATLLGDRGAALQAVVDRALVPTPAHGHGATVGEGDADTRRGMPAAAHRLRRRCAALASMALPLAAARELHAALEADPTWSLRDRLEAVAWTGDVARVPFVLDHLDHADLARVAGHVVERVTGLDLVADDLVTSRPATTSSDDARRDDPADDHVALDPDDGSPWPDTDRVHAAWFARRAAWRVDDRHIAGRPASVAACEAVLRDGRQRARLDAAWCRVVLAPGTPLFPTSAPVSRQRRLLAALGGAAA